MAITIDTHAFVWYIDKDLNGKLSNKAFETIKYTESKDVIFIPIIVLKELLHLIEKGKVNLTFQKILTMLESSDNYQIIPLDVELLKIAEKIKGLETHDRLISAVSIKTKTPLISKDRELKNKSTNVIW